MLTATLWTLILAGALLGGLSVFQELTHTYANEYEGFAQVDRLDTGGGFNIAPADATQKELRPRLGGPLGSENRYAQILAVVFPLALIRAFRDPRRSGRLAGGAASILIAGGIFLTFSRGAAVAVGLTIVLTLLLRELKFRHVLPALAVLTAVVVLVVPDYVTRLSTLGGVTALSSSTTDSADRPDSALVGRETENLAALHVFIDHPFTGVGPGVYFRDYSRDYANRLGLRYLGSERRGHSLYLEMAADTGIIGLTAFLAMVSVSLVLLYRQARYWRGRTRREQSSPARSSSPWLDTSGPQCSSNSRTNGSSGRFSRSGAQRYGCSVVTRKMTPGHPTRPPRQASRRQPRRPPTPRRAAPPRA